METVRNVTKDILWLGGSDRRLALFENMFPLENGVTYNAFLIRDEKTALIDTVDSTVGGQFLANLSASLGERPLDYLIINHMEPDHCSQIGAIASLYPAVKIVGNAKTFQMIQQFFDIDLSGRTLEVKDGDTLALGTHTLTFLFAPMVHWPEVMFAYDTHDRILFSADAFGTFGGYAGNLFSDETDYERMYLEESRRYYTNIVGKFGVQVQAALKKAGGIVPEIICPLHGPLLRGAAIELLLEKYTLWSQYIPEERGVLIAYASMYGNTENAALLLGSLLSQNGVSGIQIVDVSKTHVSHIVASAFRYSHLVLASPTYNLQLFASMEALLRDLAALALQNRDVSLIGNGSWAPTATKKMAALLGEMKDMRLLGQPLEIKSTLKPEQHADMEALAKEIADSVLGR